MRRSVVATLALIPACGVPAPSVSTTTGAETEADEDTVGIGDDDAIDTDVDPDPDPGDLRCQAEIAALTPWVTEPEGGCSVLVRVRHGTLELLGYQALCAPYQDLWLDEQAARDLTECCSTAGTFLNLPNDPNLWVFYVTPNDLGSVAVVSNHVTQRLFEASIVWDGVGDIVYPNQWLDPADLGTECGVIPMPELRSYDLVEGGTIPEDHLAEVWNVVGSTALPFAMGAVGHLQRAAVIRYPRTVGDFDPLTAEYVVVIEAGIERDDIAEPDPF